MLQLEDELDEVYTKHLAATQHLSKLTKANGKLWRGFFAAKLALRNGAQSSELINMKTEWALKAKQDEESKQLIIKVYIFVTWIMRIRTDPRIYEIHTSTYLFFAIPWFGSYSGNSKE